MTKNVRPAQTPWVAPYLSVPNPAKTLDFYTKAFRFDKREAINGEDGSVFHVEMIYKDQLIMFGQQECPEGSEKNRAKSPATTGVESPIAMYVYCEDVDQFHQHAVTQGAKSMAAPEDMFWGDRVCRLKDPDGYLWCFATHTGKMSEWKKK